MHPCQLGGGTRGLRDPYLWRSLLPVEARRLDGTIRHPSGQYDDGLSRREWILYDKPHPSVKRSPQNNAQESQQNRETNDPAISAAVALATFGGAGWGRARKDIEGTRRHFLASSLFLGKRSIPIRRDLRCIARQGP